MMNRTIKTIVTTVCVMAVLFAGFVMGMNKVHAEQIDELTTTYEARISNLNKDNNDLIKDNYELTSDMEELEHQVYCMMNGEEYKVRIHEDDTTYIYKGVKDGWFMDRSVMTIKSTIK